MKHLCTLILVAGFFFVTVSHAQEHYTIGGKEYDLKTETAGTLTLLWNTIEGEYRYFSKKGKDVVELKNTQVDGRYQEEYKETLRAQTADQSMEVDNVKLTLPGLKRFFNEYNKKSDPNYTVAASSIALKTRLGVFAGISNAVFTHNPDNTLLPVAGIDFEIMDQVKLKRHSIVLRFKQTFENADYAYSSSQFSLNYRFKFVKTETFDVFANAKFASYTYVKKDIGVIDPATGDAVMVSTSGGSLQAPATFGIGADMALGKGYLTFSYNDIVGLGVENNGEFPLDFTLGYKFNL